MVVLSFYYRCVGLSNSFSEHETVDSKVFFVCLLVFLQKHFHFALEIPVSEALDTY